MEILTETGTIVEKNGNLLKIAIPRKAECEHCDSLFCNKSSQGNIFLEIESEEQFHIGDKVEVQILGKQLVSITIFLYLIPLLLLICSLVFCLQFASINVVLSTIIAFSLIGFYYLFIKRFKLLKTKPLIKKVDTKS